jgi:lipid-A-disaccharide synthase
LQTPRAESRAALGLSENDRVVALLPGSRRSELQNVAPRVLAAAALMHRERPELRFLLPVIPHLIETMKPLLAEHAPGVPIDVLNGRSHEALAACDVTLIASGTATLEAALFKRPMVITYAVHWLTYWIMKDKGYLPWIGLPNILLRDFAVPEILQDKATPQALAAATLAWLDDAPRSEALARRFEQLHHDLRRNTAEAATHAIEKILAA